MRDSGIGDVAAARRVGVLPGFLREWNASEILIGVDSSRLCASRHRIEKIEGGSDGNVDETTRSKYLSR